MSSPSAFRSEGAELPIGPKLGCHIVGVKVSLPMRFDLESHSVNSPWQRFVVQSSSFRRLFDHTLGQPLVVLSALLIAQRAGHGERDKTTLVDQVSNGANRNFCDCLEIIISLPHELKMRFSVLFPANRIADLLRRKSGLGH